MQAAQRFNFLHIIHRGEKILDLRTVNPIVVRGKIQQSLTFFFERHLVNIFETCPSQDTADGSQNFLSDFTAQFDIDTAASHIRGNGHCPKSASSCDDLGFLGVLSGIEHLMGNATLHNFSEAILVGGR